MTTQEKVFEMIKKERAKQDGKWGKSPDHDPLLWSSITGEEMGEVCKVVIENPNNSEMAVEITQLAAVCVAWLEDILDHGGID